MDNSQRLARLQAAIDNKPFNPPIPRLTISQRDELKALVDAGRVDDALGELSYWSNVAWGKILEKVRKNGHRHNKQILEEKLLRAQIAKAEYNLNAVIAINKPDERQAETDVNKGDVGCSQSRAEPENTAKPQKKLKPHIRDNNEGLLLVYQITDKYKVVYLDELPATKAWGKIVSGEFTSDLIKDISDLKKSITLNSGEKLSKTDFLEKYRKRFN